MGMACRDVDRPTSTVSETGAWGFLSEAEGALAADTALGVTKVASGDGIGHAIAGEQGGGDKT